MLPPIPDPPAALIRQGFNATVVLVELNANADGSVSTAHAGRPKRYQPDPQAPDDLRCYAEPYVDRSRSVDGKPGSDVTWFFMFQDPYAARLDLTYKLSVVQDGDQAVHPVTLTGKSRDETGRGLYWVAEGLEYPL